MPPIVSRKLLSRLFYWQDEVPYAIGRCFFSDWPRLARWICFDAASASAVITIRRHPTAKCVTFHLSGTVQIRGKKAVAVSAQDWVTEAGRMRQVMEPGGIVMITDSHERKLLFLNPAKRLANIVERSNPPEWYVNPFEEFKSLNGKSGTPIGSRNIAGHQTQEFKVVSANTEMTVWADTKTHLPVLIEQTVKLAIFSSPETKTFSDFDWNAQVDESLMSLTPPPDYSIHTLKMNVGLPGENELIEALRTVAKLNDGRFPDSFDVAGNTQAMGRSQAKQMAAAGAHWDEDAMNKFIKSMTQAMAVVGRGRQFIDDPSNGQDWHYAGKNVELGKAAVPIMWYRPTGASDYRVIDADLTVHTAKADALPKVPSTQMGSPFPIEPATRPIGPTTRPKFLGWKTAVPQSKPSPAAAAAS